MLLISNIGEIRLLGPPCLQFLSLQRWGGGRVCVSIYVYCVTCLFCKNSEKGGQGEIGD
jgi:hypothetical protein